MSTPLESTITPAPLGLFSMVEFSTTHPLERPWFTAACDSGGGEVLDGQILDGHVGARAGDGEVVLVLAVEDRTGTRR